MRSKFATVSGLASVLTALCRASGSDAQAAAIPAAADDVVADIVVTAEGREASLQRMPAALTVLNGETIEQKQIMGRAAREKVTA